MNLTEKNKSIALKTLELIESEKCTVAQTKEILSFVIGFVVNSATVQITDEARELLG